MDVGARVGGIDIETHTLLSHARLRIYPPVECFTFPGIETRWKGPTAFSVSSERHRQTGVNEIGHVSKNYRLEDIVLVLITAL